MIRSTPPLRLLPLLLLTAALWHCAGEPAAPDLRSAAGAARGSNLLLITLDTTRADRLGCYGHAAAATPVLDRLAAEGLRFADAVTVAPVTLPAHASIMTGLDPPHHAVRDNGEYRLDEAHTTLAERLEEAGYETAAFVSAFVLDRRYGLDQGFRLYDDAVSPKNAVGLADHPDERPATAVTDAALAWLEAREVGRPFFGWVHYFDPHQPYRAPRAWDERFPGNPYDAEIAYVDSEIGRLLAALESAGLLEETLVVVTADHGEGLGEHGENSHSMLIYESVMRVPLILSQPGVLDGGVVVDGSVVGVTDIFPTVLELLDVAAPEELDGVSLLDAGSRPDRRVYMETLVPYLDNGWAPLFGLRRHADKYILAPRPEYYDLESDPTEQTNLFADPPAGPAGRDRLVEELAALLAAGPSVEGVARSARPLDSEELARLESLGYTGGVDPAPDDGRLDPKDMMPVVERIDRAKALAGAGRFDEALAELDAVAADSPDSRNLLGQMARIYVRIGREEQAERVLRRYLEIKPSTQALVLLAQIRIAAGRLDEVEPLLLQALELDPQSGAALIALGDLALERGLLDEARRRYLEAREADPYRAGPAVRSRLAMLRGRAASGS